MQLLTSRCFRAASGRRSEIFEGSDLARSAFGEDVVAHYAHFFTTEAEAYRNAVTDWERVRYFERI